MINNYLLYKLFGKKLDSWTDYLQMREVKKEKY